MWLILAKYSSTIQYNLKTTLDASGIQKLQTELNKTKATITELSSQNLINPSSVNKAISDINKVSEALKTSFNSSLGMLDFQKFTTSLSGSGITLSSLQKNLSAAGTQGTKAFNSILGAVGKFDTGIKTTSSTVDKLVTSLGNTARWGVTSRLVNGIADSFNQAVQYVQDLDDSLTQIMLVTDYSREEMDEYAKSANEAAKALGSTTTELTNASLIFAQQGFDINQSDQLAQLSTKLANASQQSTSDTSDQITAYMNAYGLSGDMEALSKAMDSWAEVANVSAADVGEIAEASQKVASTANTTGVTMDQLNAQIATIESVTRDAPESIGNGLKTIYARFSDIEAGETLDDGVSLGTVTSTLSKLGVEVLDGDGKMRGVGDIMEDLMDVWDSIDSTQKAAVAQTLAGKNQLARFEALMNSSDMYDSYKSSSENADGTLDEMNDKYVNSLEGKTKQIQASLEGVFSSLFDTDAFYPLLDALKDALNLMQQFSEAVGGGRTLILALGAAASKVFGSQISENIANMINNNQQAKLQKQNLSSREGLLNTLGIQNVEGNNSKAVVDAINIGTKYAGSFSTEQMEAYNKKLQDVVDTSNALAEAQTNLEEQIKLVNLAAGEKVAAFSEETGGISYTQGDALNSLNDGDNLSKVKEKLEEITETNQIFAQDARIAYQSYQKAVEEAKEATDTFSDAASEDSQKAQERFVKFTNYAVEDLKTLRDALKEVDSVSENTINDVLSTLEKGHDLSEEQMDSLFVHVIQQYQDLKNKIEKNKTGLSGQDVIGGAADAAITYSNANTAQKSSEDNVRNLDSVMSTQGSVQSVVNLTQSIVSLTSAWSAFQNLGSIWSNDDISDGEKLLQTIENLAFAIPSLYSGYKEFEKIDFSKMAESMTLSAAKIGVEAETSAASMELMGPVAVKAGAAVETGMATAAAGVAGLGTAIQAALPWLFAISAAVSVITSAISGYQDSLEDAADTANTKFSTNSSVVSLDTSSFDEAYSTFKKTGVVTDDLKSSMSSLADSVDDASLKAYAASGNYEAFADQLKVVQEEAKNTQEELYNAAEAASKTAHDSVTNFTENNNKKDVGLDTSEFNDASIAERIGQIKDVISQTETKIEELKAEGANEVELSQAESTKEKAEALLESYSDDVTRIETYAKTALADMSSDAFSGMSIEDAENSLKENYPAVMDFYNNMGSDAKISFLQGYGAETTLADLDFSDQSQEIQETMSSIQDYLDTSDEIKLTASFSKEEILENLDSIIDGLNSGEDVDTVIARVKMQISNSESDIMDDTDLSDRLSELDVDDDVVDTYQQQLTSLGKLNERLPKYTQDVEEAEKALDNMSDSVDENSDEYKDQQKKVNQAKSALTAYNKSQKRVTQLAVQSQKGLDELNTALEDNEDVLKNGDKSSLEYSEAMTEVRQAVADLVNVSEDDISVNFVEDNFDTIQQAATGDQEAINELRAATAEDLVMNFNSDGATLANDQLQLLQDKAAELTDSSIDMEASLNDDGFMDSVNEMLAKGEVSTDQIQSYFNAMGYDPVIDYVDGDTETHTTDVGTLSVAGLPGIPYTMDHTSYTDVKVPKITSVEGAGDDGSSGAGVSSGTPSKSSGGSSKSSGGGSGGSSGGSSSGSSYTPKTMDKDDSGLDLYEKVSTKLDAIAADYDKVANAQDRLSGVEVAKNMQEQVSLIQKQVDLYKEKQAIQEKEASDLRSELSSTYGISFDSDGFIANYADVYNNLYNEYSNLVDQYNATTDESGQDALSDQIDEAQDKLDKFNDKYQRYDELWSSDLKDTIQQLEDLQDEIEDLQATAFDNLVSGLDDLMDINDTLDEINENWDHLANGLKEDPFADLERNGEKLKRFYDNQFSDQWYDKLISYYDDAAEKATGSQKEFYQTLADQYRNGKSTEGDGTMAAGGSGYFDMSLQSLQLIQDQIKEFEETGYSSIFGENSAALYESAENVYNQVSDVISDFKDVWDDIHDDIMDSIDEMADKMDDRKESFEAINDELEHYANIIETVHGDKAYDQQNQILQVRYSNYQSEITELQNQKKIWEEMLETMEEGSEEWDEVSEKIKDASEEINDLVEESLDALQEAYENTVNSVLDTWTDSAFGGSDLDWIETEWELINRNADYYLDDVNKAYNIQKLQSQYLDLLDDADGLATQQKITAQMNQQLDYLRDKTNLSEYDVQYAQAQLEILQKQIALEEAQNNKNNMKLRRDSQGNYSYVYTADESSTRSAESDLLDAQNNAYNLSKDQMKQTQDDSLSALTDAKSTLMDIWTDASLTVEEREKRVETVIDSLKEYLASTSEQLSTSQQNLINDFIGMCEILTEENSEGMQNVYDQIKQGNSDAFDEIDTRWSTSITNWMQNLDTFNQSTDDAMADLKEDAENYEKDINSVASQVGQDFNDMSDAIDDCKDKQDALNASSKEFYNLMESNSGSIQNYEKQIQSLSAQMQDATNEMANYRKQTEDLQKDLSEQKTQNALLVSQNTKLQQQVDSLTNGSGYGSGSGRIDNLSVGSVVGYNGRYYYDSWGENPSGSLYAGKSGAVKVDEWSSTKYGGQNRTTGDFDVHISTPSGGDLGWVKKSQLFDTGGYTGDWFGSGVSDAKDGKLAFLHQKELVLNSSDTENILAAVEAVRSFADGIKNGALGVFSSMFSGTSATAISASEGVQQEVHITAEFPNANSAAEIESALLSLNDRSIQYAYKNR